MTGDWVHYRNDSERRSYECSKLKLYCSIFHVQGYSNTKILLEIRTLAVCCIYFSKKNAVPDGMSFSVTTHRGILCMGMCPIKGF